MPAFDWVLAGLFDVGVALGVAVITGAGEESEDEAVAVMRGWLLFMSSDVDENSVKLQAETAIASARQQIVASLSRLIDLPPFYSYASNTI